MVKRLTLYLILLTVSMPGFSQLDPYKYRIGAGIGYTNYHGDFSPYRIKGFKNLERLFEYNPNYIPEASYSLTLERRLSRSMSLMLSGGRYVTAMSDRYLQKDGSLYTNNPNFDRALNFRTSIVDAGLGLVFRTDNDRILNKNAFLAPYLMVGAGYSWFDTSGDLLDGEGNRYSYGSGDITPDALYETPLRPLRTETEMEYRNGAFYLGMGLGMRLRIIGRMELFVQSDFRRSYSDYIDDVSGKYKTGYEDDFQQYAALPGTNVPDLENPYRGTPNGATDWYIFHQAGIRFSFIPSKMAFRASKISPSRSFLASSVNATPESTPSTDSRQSEEPSASGNQFFNFFQINPASSQEDRLSRQVSYLEKRILILDQGQQLAAVNSEIRLLEMQIDSLNSVATELAGEAAIETGNADRIASVQAAQLETAQRLSEAQGRRMAIAAEIRESEASLISLEARDTLPTSRTATLDTLVFIQGFKHFSDQIARSLNQPQNWNQLQSGVENLGRSQPIPSQGTIQPRVTESVQPDYTQPYPPYTGIPYDRPVYSYSEQYRQTYPSESRRARRRQPETVYPYTDQRATAPIAQPFYYPYSPTGSVPTTVIGPTLQLGRSEGEVSLESEQQENELSVTTSTVDAGEQQGNRQIAGGMGMAGVDTVLIDNKVIVGFPVSKREVYFDTNRAELSEAENAKLQEVASILQQHGTYFLILTGFSDNTGSISYNLTLAERRVNHVKELLVARYGVDPERIGVNPAGVLVRGSRGVSRNEDRKVEIQIEVEIEI